MASDSRDPSAHAATPPTTEPSDAPSRPQPEIYAPPAHIAARFYRKQLTRRKSSAASSRRNSLSSAHSHASSHRRSSAPGCQSHSIAQHLRRASIIESRRARLADRAAHAEQVRLRAALVKAAPRGNSTVTEERAIAAQLAKEKYLARVAAACAEEVARAKRVAEEVKERKLAEEARVRLEMEERHAEAERRRAEYQRNLQLRRARRADSAEKKLAVVEEVADADDIAVVEDAPTDPAVIEASAARCLQRTWRLHRRKQPVTAFQKLYINTPRVQNTPFEEMTALVADSGVIAATTGILTHLGLQDAGDENAALNTRTFLSAYLIVGHPVAVLNKSGTQEQDLIAKATDLVNHFEASLSRLASWNAYSPNPMQLETLSQSYTAYTSAFAAWRLQDSSVLIEGMVASFVELDAIWQTVKDDTRGEVANDYREGIRDQQVMLLSRIRKLAGPDRADTLIKKAIRESRRRRPKKRAAAEIRPRGIEPATSATAAASEKAVEQVGLDASSAGSGEITKLFTPMPSNRVLTHELAIDKDYRLEDKHGEIRNQLYRSMCESMKMGFEAGEGALWTVSAAQNIREKLLRMLKPGNTMHALISDTLDLEHIHRQCQQGVFSYPGFFQFMANILPKLCAPFRDQEVKTLTEALRADAQGDELGSMIEKLFQLLRMVDLLSLDYTNFMIMNASAVLIQEAAGYEHRLFAQDLSSGSIGLEQTTRWWRSSSHTLTAEADRRDPDGVRHPADRPSPHHIYTHALVDLALTTGPLDPDLVPETLRLDTARLSALRVKAVRIVVIGAILLTTKNLLKRDVRSQWKSEAARLSSLLATASPAYGGGEESDDSESESESSSSSAKAGSLARQAFTVLDQAHNMPPGTRTAVAATIKRFFAQAADVMGEENGGATAPAVKFTDPVLKLVFQRLKSHVLARLSAESSAERVRAASSASEKLAASGMAEFAAQVAEMVGLLERIRKVDWEAHGEWYLSIARDGDGVSDGNGELERVRQ